MDGLHLVGDQVERRTAGDDLAALHGDQCLTRREPGARIVPAPLLQSVALRHVPDRQGRLRQQAASSPSPVRSDERAGPGRRRRLVSTAAAMPALPTVTGSAPIIGPRGREPQGGWAGSLRRHRPRTR